MAVILSAIYGKGKAQRSPLYVNNTLTLTNLITTRAHRQLMFNATFKHDPNTILMTFF